jgi:hypothetical protein
VSYKSETIKGGVDMKYGKLYTERQYRMHRFWWKIKMVLCGILGGHRPKGFYDGSSVCTRCDKQLSGAYKNYDDMFT